MPQYFSFNPTHLTHHMCWKMRPNLTRPNTTHGWTQPMSISGQTRGRWCWTVYLFCLLELGRSGLVCSENVGSSCEESWLGRVGSSKLDPRPSLNETSLKSMTSVENLHSKSLTAVTVPIENFQLAVYILIYCFQFVSSLSTTVGHIGSCKVLALSMWPGTLTYDMTFELRLDVLCKISLSNIYPENHLVQKQLNAHT